MHLGLFMQFACHFYVMGITNTIDKNEVIMKEQNSLLFVHTESQQVSKFGCYITHFIAFHLEPLTLSV